VKANRLLYFGALVIFGVGATVAHAQGKSNGHGKGHDKDKHSDGDYDRDGRDGRDGRDYAYSYSPHDRDELHHWYDNHRGNLPPGLAKKDRLPPGWEKKMVVRQVMPVEYREYVRPAPAEIVRILPPPPDCEHVVVGGQIVLMNRKTSVVLDIFSGF
jgi:hypothetical protein